MGQRDDRLSNEPFLFALVVMLVCFAAFGLTLRLAGGVSSADGRSEQILPRAELRALAQQATLRVAVRSCGDVTQGSGFIVGPWLITNEHLLDGADEIKADQPIDPVILAVVGVSPPADLAAAVAPAGVSLALSVDRPDVGDSVILAGHADGHDVEVQPGVVANLVPGAAYGLDSEVLLIDATTRGGYSGGPVLDGAGNVVAILSGFDRATGLTVAVPASEIAAFVELLPATGTVTGGRDRSHTCPNG